MDRLTPRQAQVARLLCQGLSNKEIAQELGLKTSTIKTHVQGIMAAWSVESRLQIALALHAAQEPARASGYTGAMVTAARGPQTGLGVGTKLANKKVLVVEDDSSVSYLVCETLRDEGADVLPTADGRAALAIVDTYQPDVICLDLMLPYQDGWDVVRCLRAEAKRRGAAMPRLVIMTAGYRARDAAQEMGVPVWCAKPFRIREIVDSILLALNSDPPAVDFTVP